jgi:uncharacterized membrane protein (DUF106 family)
MIQLIIGLFWGFVMGYCICMLKVSKLQNQLTRIRIDALHESNKESLLRKLRKEQPQCK